MSDTKVNNEMIEDSGKVSSGQIKPNSISSTEITNSSITNSDISPSAAIANAKVPGISTLCTTATSINATVGAVSQNIALLGFKMAVNDGLTLFNLVDGVVDEFNDESGVDTAENVAMSYDSTSDFYRGGVGLSLSLIHI